MIELQAECPNDLPELFDRALAAEQEVPFGHATLGKVLKSDRLCAGTRCDNGLRLYNEPLDQSSQCL